MATASQQIARPIFIVSTGRSGSTILTWCLGQHPNIIPQEESNWLGAFAIYAAVGAYGPEVCYRLRYADLRDQPEEAIGALLGFLGEPYAPTCLEPLGQRINTANVHAG